MTPEQRTYARLAGLCVFANYVTQGVGDSVTIILRNGETFAQTARFAAESPVLWRFALLNVGIAWIVIGVFAFALYAVLEPVNRRLAQLALVLRLGASFVGAASVMFRVAQARLYSASTTDLFTTDQLRILSGVVQRGAGEGVEIAWMFQGLGSTIFFVLLLRSRYVPRPVAWLGIVGSPLLVAASMMMFVFPQRINELKLLGLPTLVAEVAMALLFLIKGLPSRATAEARG